LVTQAYLVGNVEETHVVEVDEKQPVLYLARQKEVVPHIFHHEDAGHDPVGGVSMLHTAHR
jgi:hypothetical protein